MSYPLRTTDVDGQGHGGEGSSHAQIQMKRNQIFQTKQRTLMFCGYFLCIARAMAKEARRKP